MSGQMRKRTGNKSTKRLIGELLVASGVISGDMLREALRRQASQGGKTVENLMELGYIDHERFTHFLARQPGVASILLEHYEVDKAVLALIPRKFAVEEEVFPLDRMGPLLTVAMVCPLDSPTLGLLEDMTGLKVSAVLCSSKQIRMAIEQYYTDDDEPMDISDWFPTRAS